MWIIASLQLWHCCLIYLHCKWTKIEKPNYTSTFICNCQLYRPTTSQISWRRKITRKSTNINNFSHSRRFTQQMKREKIRGYLLHNTLKKHPTLIPQCSLHQPKMCSLYFNTSDKYTCFLRKDDFFHNILEENLPCQQLYVNRTIWQHHSLHGTPQEWCYTAVNKLTACLPQHQPHQKIWCLVPQDELS